MVRAAPVLVLVAMAAIIPGACSTTPARVTLYGDSLGVESKDELADQLRGAATLTASVQGGAALCDVFAGMKVDLERRKPNVALLQFSGNNITDCTRGPDGTFLQGDELVAKYANDATLAVAMLREHDVTVYLVGSPITAQSTMAARINAEYQRIADQWEAQGSGVSYIDAGATVLTPDGRFTPQLSCLDTETAADGCTNGHIIVRAPDGLHFCPTVSGGTQPCPVYSSGAHRFAGGMAGPVRDHLGHGLLSGL
jgi:hypothetical protein